MFPTFLTSLEVYPQIIIPSLNIIIDISLLEISIIKLFEYNPIIAITNQLTSPSKIGKI